MADLFGQESRKTTELNGVAVHHGWLDRAAQESMLADLRKVAEAAPVRAHRTPGGRKMSVRMTAAGAVGWISDAAGYRYSEKQPDGRRWPNIPSSVLSVWQSTSGVERIPDSCLINFYGKGARMGLHQDRDEADFQWPVVSISLGDPGLFRVGQTTRGGATKSVWLHSGDVAVLGGDSRLAYHGVDRIRFGESDLLPDGGRVNITLRVAR